VASPEGVDTLAELGDSNLESRNLDASVYRR
jgi:hypothetical protein